MSAEIGITEEDWGLIFAAENYEIAVCIYMGRRINHLTEYHKLRI